MNQYFIMLFGLSASLGSLSAFAIDTEDFSSIHQRVFGDNSEVISPTETLDLLKRLVSLKSDLDAMIEKGEIMGDTQFKDMKLIKEMIEASRIVNEKCNLNSVMGLNMMIEQNIDSPVNAIPYLESCKSQQLIMCKDTFTDILNRAINRLTDEQKIKMTKLLRCIKRQSGQESVANSATCAHLTGKQLDAAIVDFLETTLTTIDPRLMQKEWRDHPEARKEIMTVCSLIVRELEESVTIFNEFIGDRVLTDQLDQTTTDWIFTYNVCQHILRMIDESSMASTNNTDHQPSCPKYCPGYYPGRRAPGCHQGSRCCTDCCCTGGSGYPGGRCELYQTDHCQSHYPGYCPGRCGHGCGCYGKKPSMVE